MGELRQIVVVVVGSGVHEDVQLGKVLGDGEEATSVEERLERMLTHSSDASVRNYTEYVSHRL